MRLKARKTRNRTVLYHHWARLGPNDKSLWQLCAMAMVVFLFHYVWFSPWYVEDAAISFAFARNAALGEGFVGYPGGERVEGFSNPTWTLVLTAGEFIGLSSWYMAKLWGAVFGLLGLPLSMRWFKELRTENQDLWPAMPTLLLAMSPQYVMWASSGLENALLCLCMAWGSVRTLQELRRGGRPWSGLIWGLVAISRPEAPLYAFIAGMMGGVTLLATQGTRRVLYWAPRWLGLCTLVFASWHLWRYAYFGWEFPNTYYAKLDGTGKFLPWSWRLQGWKYLTGYALVSGTGFWFWLYIMGQTGFTGWRKRVGILATIVLTVLVIPGLEWIRAIPGWPILAEATWWAHLRIETLFALFVILPLIGIGRKGWPARTLAWTLMSTVLFFTLYSGWDWMQGYRWLSFCAIPMAVLVSDALAQGWTARKNHMGQGHLRLWVYTPIFIVFCISLVTTIVYINRLETSPFDVHRRVQYMQGVQKRLHLDRASLLEVDMGAHMWWSGFELVDMAGLIDVPMGHHKWEKPFIKEYVFQERRPEFAHVHGSWASRTKMRTHKEWKEYLPISPYPSSRRYHHTGNHIRKDLIVRPNWSGPRGRRVRFTGGLRLHGWTIPAPVAVPGEQMYFEIGLSRFKNQPDFRLVAFITNGTRTVMQEVPPGYDWYPPRRWKRNKEVVHGFHALQLPKDLPTGDYDFGFAVYDRHGARTIEDAPKEAVIDSGLHFKHEVRWPNSIRIVSNAEGRAAANTQREASVMAAETGACTDADHSWNAARKIWTEDAIWLQEQRTPMRQVLAACWANHADSATEDAVVRTSIQRARHLHHRSPIVIQTGRRIAQRYLDRADVAEKNGTLDDAYQALRIALTADPTQSWTRRRAERIRDQRLGITADQTDAK